MAMTKKNTLFALTFVLLIGACGGSEQDRAVPTAQPAGVTNAEIGDWVVHFSALATDQLSPEVARAYNIVRRKNRAMLTISVIRKADGAAVAADIGVNTVNLTGQLKNVTIRRIDEGDAIYYIGETPVAHRETLVFDLTVTPEGASKPAELRFKREFFTD